MAEQVELAAEGQRVSLRVGSSSTTNHEAMAYVQQRLRRMGVERALARAGVNDGDLVRIGALELTYEEGM